MAMEEAARKRKKNSVTWEQMMAEQQRFAGVALEA